MTYKTIRKNATKQIEALLSKATVITKTTQYRDFYTDCFESSSVKSDINELRDYMNENYRVLTISLILDENGNEEGLQIGVNGWSKCEFFVDFTEKETEETETETEIEITNIEITKKPMMTLKAVQAFLAKGFISPLNSGAKIEIVDSEDEDKIIESIFVHWSESNSFDCVEGKEISLETYTKCEWNALAIRKQHGDLGYSKTKVTLTLKSGHVAEFRHDICMSERDISKQWCKWVDYCKSK